MLLVSQMAFATFRLIGALSRNMAIAYTFGSFFLVAIMSLGGFVLSRGIKQFSLPCSTNVWQVDMLFILSVLLS